MRSPEWRERRESRLQASAALAAHMILLAKRSFQIHTHTQLLLKKSKIFKPKSFCFRFEASGFAVCMILVASFFFSPASSLYVPCCSFQLNRLRLRQLAMMPSIDAKRKEKSYEMQIFKAKRRGRMQIDAGKKLTNLMVFN